MREEMGKDDSGAPGGAEPSALTEVERRTRHPKQLGGEFMFEAGVSYRRWSATTVDGPHYVVRLPHQCDEWDIAWADDAEKAIAEVECFIQEAQAALRVLREEAASFGRGDVA